MGMPRFSIDATGPLGAELSLSRGLGRDASHNVYLWSGLPDSELWKPGLLPGRIRRLLQFGLPHAPTAESVFVYWVSTSRRSSGPVPDSGLCAIRNLDFLSAPSLESGSLERA